MEKGTLDRPLASLLFALALIIAPCLCARITHAGVDPSPEPSSSGKWVLLHPGKEIGGFELHEDGTVSYQGRKFTPNPKLKTEYESGDGIHYVPMKLVVSPVDPSGSYAFIKSCEEIEETGRGRAYGICWHLYLADIRNGRLMQTFAGRYGPREWVEWSPDVKYAVLAYHDECWTFLCRIDLGTGDSKGIPVKDLGRFRGSWTCPVPCLIVDFSSLAWQKTENRFNVEARISCDLGHLLDTVRTEWFELEIDISGLRTQAKSKGVEIESSFQKAKVEAFFYSAEELSQFTANPFPWKGKIIGLAGNFEQMLSGDSALFRLPNPTDINKDIGFVVIKKIPSTRFKKRGETVYLAGTLRGMTEVSVPVLGRLLVPELEMTGAKELSPPGEWKLRQ